MKRPLIAMTIGTFMLSFAYAQRANCVHERLKDLILPFEHPYRSMREDIAQRIGLDPA